MTYVESDNIISPLGMTTEENLQAVRAGRSALRLYKDGRNLLEPYTASLLTEAQRRQIAVEGLTEFESMIVSSARKALEGASFNPADEHVALIISSTKGNISLMQTGTEDSSLVSLGESARKIASALGVKTMPITVCNACISGLSAIILAQRLLSAGSYEHAIVCGADCQNEFIISGFQSLKALSQEECRPFDMERTGLNLGEAAATLILSSKPTRDRQWVIRKGAVHNDAYHTTQPAKKGDGLLLCLQDITKGEDTERLALVNAHGTATLFNDQMESQAVERAGLSAVPVNALKGYYGHTMGAAGLLETIISMHGLDNRTIFGTRGFEERGVSGKIPLSNKHEVTDKTAFIKTISGFGGCNAAIIADLRNVSAEEDEGNIKEQGCSQKDTKKGEKDEEETLLTLHRVVITPRHIVSDGEEELFSDEEQPLLTRLYKALGCSYPKFYKMDSLSKLGFIASFLLLNKHAEEQNEHDKEQDEHAEGRQEPQHADCAIVLFNKSSSVSADRKYLSSISDAVNYFPSPSVFIYTLPNIVTGEIAIFNGFHGETSFYILPWKDETVQKEIVDATFGGSATELMITGWLDYEDESHFEADLRLIRKE